MKNIKLFNVREQRITAKREKGIFAFLANYKGRNIVYKTTDKTLYEDIDSNERRSKAARTFVYERIKHIYYTSVNSDIVVGGYYECIKDYIKDELFYREGERYRSDESGCITDKKGDTFHSWDSEELKEYFKYVD